MHCQIFSVNMEKGEDYSMVFFFFVFLLLKGERGSPGPVGPPGEKGIMVSYKQCRILNYVTYKGSVVSKTVISSHPPGCTGLMGE